MSEKAPSHDLTNLLRHSPQALSGAETSQHGSSSRAQYDPPNNDTQNPFVPPHFSYSPAMCPPVYKEDLIIERPFEAFEKIIDEYFGNLPFIKGVSGMRIIGREFDIRSSHEHPLVIYVMIDSHDIPLVTEEVYQTSLRLVHEHFQAPVPPFRFYVSDTTLY